MATPVLDHVGRACRELGVALGVELLLQLTRMRASSSRKAAGRELKSCARKTS